METEDGKRIAQQYEELRKSKAGKSKAGKSKPKRKRPLFQTTFNDRFLKLMKMYAVHQEMQVNDLIEKAVKAYILEHPAKGVRFDKDYFGDAAAKK